MTFSDHQTKLKNYIRRLSHSLQGKPDLDLPDIQLQDFEKILQDLITIPETDWWNYAFSREPMNGRFRDEERISLYLQALECGKKQAERCMETYGTSNPEQLAALMNLDVLFPEMPQSHARILFADFAEPKTIRVYRDGLDKAGALLYKPGMNELFPEHVKISDILIAHELYHVLEMKDPALWSKSYRMTLWQIGMIKNQSPIAVLSEIAAMAFAARLNRLPFSPYVLDAFLVYGYSPKAASALYEEMVQSARKASRISTSSVPAMLPY